MLSEYTWNTAPPSPDDWMIKFLYLKYLYETTGSCIVKSDLWIPETGAVGQWQTEQREAAKNGTLSNEKLQLLYSIQFPFEIDKETEWQERYEQLAEYKKRYHSIVITPSTVERGAHLKALNQWLEQQKAADSDGTLSPEHRKKLIKIGLLPDVKRPSRTWIKRYKMAAAYYEKYHHLRVKNPYYVEDNFDLGSWVYFMCKNKEKLLEEQIQMLEQIGMVWETVSVQRWKLAFAHLLEFQQEYGHIQVPKGFRTQDNFSLSAWCLTQAKRYRSDLLSDEQKQMLDSIGFDKVFQCQETDLMEEWKQYYELVAKFLPEHPEKLNDKLKKWIDHEQRILDKRINCKRTPEQFELLAKIGIVPGVYKTLEERWQQRFEETVTFLKQNGHLPRRVAERSLYTWIRSQRKKFAENKLTAEQIELLHSIGVIDKSAVINQQKEKLSA